MKKLKEIDITEMQEMEMQLLLDFDAVCRKHNLRYSLIYGTLLGAIRHHGFIPWDDDIDVVMPREDYDKLKTLKDEFEEHHCLCDHQITKGYIHPIAKLVNTKTVLIEKLNIDSVMPLGVYIDIFPADKVPMDATAFHNFQDKCFKNSRKLAFSVLKFTETGNVIKNGMKKIVLNYYHKKGATTYLKQYDQLVEESKAFTSSRNKIIAFPEHCENDITDEEFNDLIEMQFENHNFLVLACYERLLRANYNDYMQLPPEEERVSNHDTIVYWK